MALIPIRGVGELGVVTDLSPQDLPLKAWNDARNIRFAEGKLSRYSLFKFLDEAYSFAASPVGIFDGGAPGDEGYVISVFGDGTMQQRYAGVTTDVTPTGSLSLNTEQITVSKLGGLTFMSRPGDTPIYRESPADGDFAPVPGWTPGDSCSALRAFKDFLVALDVTKAGVRYSGMVKWSNAVQAGAPPADWNVLLDSSLAGETILNDLTGPLIDGLSLGDSFILYGQNETFRMDYIGEPFIFRFSKIFTGQGMIARNCAVEVEGKHYVFGASDILVHDGMVRQSIANGRVLDTVFSELDYLNRGRCFVTHDKVNGEILFCYPSSDDGAQWVIGDIEGCNRAAVFNYRFNTWTFVDLPSLIGSSETSLVQLTTWDTIPDETWGDTAASWSSFSGQNPRNLVLTGTGNPALSKAGTIYFLDNAVGGRLTNPVDPDVRWEAYALAEYKDVDDLGATIEGRKLIRKVVPQFVTEAPEDYVQIVFGQSKRLTDSISWGITKDLFPWIESKYDCRINGRYLSMRVIFPASTAGEFSGYDLDLIMISGR